MLNLRGIQIKNARLKARMAGYRINKCSLNANKFKIYVVHFLEFQIKLIKQNTAYASY